MPGYAPCRLALSALMVAIAIAGAGALSAHPFDKVVPQIRVIADLHHGQVRVEYIFEYRTLDASLEEQTKREVGLDADGDRTITVEERRTRVRAYCDEVLQQAVLTVDGAKVPLSCDYPASDAYRLQSADEIEMVGNWLLGYVLVLKSDVLGKELAPGKRLIAFHNAERRIQRTSLLSDAMRGIVWWPDARLGHQVSDAFDRTFAVVDGVFDQIRFSVDVKPSAWHAAPEPKPEPKPEPIPPTGTGTPPEPQPPPAEPPPSRHDAVARARSEYDATPKTQSEADEGKIKELIAQVKGGGLATVLALLAFLLWGAWHAIQPGHGKTLVASYLIGTHGRPRDAITLGITVTLAHVSGVFVFLGLYLLVEWLNPELVSRSAVQDGMVIVFGAVILLMGLGLVLKAAGGGGHHHDIFGRHTDAGHAHDHDHGHSHTHSHGPEVDPSKLTTWEIIRLGILGGMLPCPAAVTLALVMMTQGEAMLGVVLLVVFSVGLAAVLSAIGLVMVATRSYLKEKASRQRPWVRGLVSKLPLFGGLAITLIGFVMIMAALHRMEVLDLRAFLG